jgi:hypothetical protein
MRITAIVAFVAVVHIASASIAAQQPKPSSQPRFLFPTPAPTLNQPADARFASKPTVVCGLTLIPGDPNVDPAIRREVPEDGPRYSIRTVEPKLCRRP